MEATRTGYAPARFHREEETLEILALSSSYSADFLARKTNFPSNCTKSRVSHLITATVVPPKEAEKFDTDTITIAGRTAVSFVGEAVDICGQQFQLQ